MEQPNPEDQNTAAYDAAKRATGSGDIDASEAEGGQELAEKLRVIKGGNEGLKKHFPELRKRLEKAGFELIDCHHYPETIDETWGKGDKFVDFELSTKDAITLIAGKAGPFESEPEAIAVLAPLWEE